jgi:hypothetical protein
VANGGEGGRKRSPRLRRRGSPRPRPRPRPRPGGGGGGGGVGPAFGAGRGMSRQICSVRNSQSCSLSCGLWDYRLL